MKLSEIATFVEDKISSNSISLADYVTTDSLLPNKEGKALATNLPPVICSLTHFRKGDVLVANIRPYLKKVWLADKEGGCSSDVLVFRVKEGNKSSFLYAIMLQDRFFDYAMKGAKGSKMPRGDKDQIMRYELPTFYPQEQENIGNLVISITNKLWLNRSINHNLEAMAKQLYDYWFVQFDFPDENGKPYKSSGGKMVWNEKLKREIPEDWKVAQLGNICSFRNGINYAKDEIGEPYAIVNVRNISATSILLDGEDFDVITIPLSKATNYILTEKDIVIARSGCPGSTRLLHTSNKTLFCGFIICCTPIEEYLRNYITLFLKILEGSSATTSGGSILQNVSQDTLKSLWIILPSIKLLMIFDRFLKDLIDLLYSNSMAIKILTKQRDELLPLLMNGQVKVGVERSRLNYDLIFLDSPIFSLL